jgi:hypothetical protein
MSPVGFETTISTDERPETYALDGAGAGTDEMAFSDVKFANELNN